MTKNGNIWHMMCPSSLVAGIKPTKSGHYFTRNSKWGFIIRSLRRGPAGPSLLAPATKAATPLVWLDIVKNEILQESQKTNSARNWSISPFFPLHPISLCSKVLITSSNLWRASPTTFRASKKVKNWQNITFSWTGECTHTQFLCLYGDNWHIITIQKEENLLSHKKSTAYLVALWFLAFWLQD